MRLRVGLVLSTVSLAGCSHAAASVADSAGSPACSASHLSASTALTPMGAGNDAYRISIVDHGQPCSLRGRPQGLVGVYASGRSVVLKPGTVSADYLRAQTTGLPANLSAGRHADVVLVSTIGCAAGQHPPANAEMFSSLRIRVGPSWLSVEDNPGPEPYDTDIWFPCGVGMSGYYASFPSTH